MKSKCLSVPHAARCGVLTATLLLIIANADLAFADHVGAGVMGGEIRAVSDARNNFTGDHSQNIINFGVADIPFDQNVTSVASVLGVGGAARAGWPVACEYAQGNSPSEPLAQNPKP